ncbi:ATP-binding response regulator [Metasolibacillus fluoroglycofenilyticus]|uniref:ATP-binding response regulator n=1 Tax=Metasolibacillus fluoroglycofenilyticus TaxID=1239396 RepID=UPI00137B0486|nr:ATP-binding protein [Metasolibacillus fluoroglycofenilyticus]
MLTRNRKYKRVLQITIIFSLFIVLLFSLRFSWLHYFSFSNEAEINKGVLDFEQIQNTREFKMHLDGEWVLFPNILLISKDAMQSGTSLYSHLPETWDPYLEQKPGHVPYGSYYLKIINVPDLPIIYSLTIPASLSPYTLYVNEKYTGSHGKHTLNPKKPSEDPRPATFHFQLQPGDNEIIISGFHMNQHLPGGLTTSLIFGDSYSIDQIKWYSIIAQIIVCAFIVFYALSAILLLILGVKRSAIGYFLLLITSLFMTIILSSDKLLLSYVKIDWVSSAKILQFSYAMMLLWLILFFNELTKKYIKTKILNIFAFICFVYLLLIATMPIDFIYYMEFIFYMLFVITAILLTVFIYKIALLQRKGYIMLLLIAAALINHSVFLILNHFVTTSYTYYPFDLLIVVTAFLAFWFISYFYKSSKSEQLASNLQQEMYRKDDFLANTSNELRTPLQHMLSIAQSLLAQKEQHDLRLLVTIGQHMSFMLDGLLDLIHLKEQTIKLEITPVNINQIVTSVCDMFQLAIKDKPLKLLIDLPADLPPVLADENRLIQVFINLIHNAIKFTDEGSITIHAKVLGNQLYISVIDTGIGIEKSKQSLIFEPYEQVEANITSHAHIGLGLGLSISKEIIELHGGSLDVTSTFGIGSTFTFSLPIAKGLTLGQSESSLEQSNNLSKYIFLQNDLTEIVQELAVSASEHVATANPAHILLVDADPLSLQVLLKALTTEFYQIETAMNGIDALAKIEKHSFDLVISDTVLPQMSGYELAKQIRQRFSISELPILFLTARQQSEDIRLAFLNGANDYVKKPIEYVELKSRVDALIQVKQSSEERLRFEAAWLQAQIQPHFFFNTLNAIISLHNVDNEKMEELLLAFNDYLQMSFNFENVDLLVPIDYELRLVRSYMAIEQIRFDNRIAIVWDIPDNIAFSVPPLALQTLVENAVRHGLLSRPEGGTVTLRIIEHAEHYLVEIIDDGVGFEKKLIDPKESVGLTNTEQRLKQLFGVTLTIDSVVGKGTTISFPIPKENH